MGGHHRATDSRLARSLRDGGHRRGVEKSRRVDCQQSAPCTKGAVGAVSEFVVRQASGPRLYPQHSAGAEQAEQEALRVLREGWDWGGWWDLGVRRAFQGRDGQKTTAPYARCC